MEIFLYTHNFNVKTLLTRINLFNSYKRLIKCYNGLLLTYGIYSKLYLILTACRRLNECLFTLQRVVAKSRMLHHFLLSRNQECCCCLRPLLPFIFVTSIELTLMARYLLHKVRLAIYSILLLQVLSAWALLDALGTY